jgi:hypothetical protein
VLRLQLRLHGWVTTWRFVLIITQAGTRRFCSHAFASLIFLAFDILLIFFTT